MNAVEMATKIFLGHDEMVRLKLKEDYWSGLLKWVEDNKEYPGEEYYEHRQSMY